MFIIDDIEIKQGRASGGASRLKMQTPFHTSPYTMAERPVATQV